MFSVGQKNDVKKHWLEWTIHTNLKLWFDLWANFLLERGLAREPTEEESFQGIETVPFENQDCHTLNLDETDLSLASTNGKGHGRKAKGQVNIASPAGHTQKNKSSDRCTTVTGLNAAGEPLPAHVQFESSAKN